MEKYIQSVRWDGVCDDDTSTMHARTGTKGHRLKLIPICVNRFQRKKVLTTSCCCEKCKFSTLNQLQGRARITGACQDRFNTKRHKSKKIDGFVAENDLHKCECFPQTNSRTHNTKKALHKSPRIHEKIFAFMGQASTRPQSSSRQSSDLRLFCYFEKCTRSPCRGRDKTMRLRHHDSLPTPH